MSRHSMMIPFLVLGLLILGIVPAMAATQPTLYTINSGTPKVLGQGVQKSWPIKVNEDQAFDATFKGGMWLPNPTGGQIYVKYQRHILHDNGTWTWIGKVSTVHGDQSVVLTFGKDGVFGLVPQASGYPLRIMTRKGQTTVVATSAQAMARSAKALDLYSRPDYVIPPRVAPKDKSTAVAPHSAAGAAVHATASGSVTINVMVAYTPGFVTELGSQSLALTRIQNLVDTTNQAYINSGVNQQIQLVNTVEVNYPDNTANQSALDDVTGIDEKGNPVTIPASLQGIAGLRVQYSADLVTLIRSFDYTTQGNCGVGWLIGGNQAPIVPSQSYVYGYNVVSDGTSSGYYCLDTTFAHELGHNMGNAHDRADATDPDGAPLSGAYPYSYGYLGTGSNGTGFSTIMAYGTSGDTPLATFSNPNISTCLNSPCGVADNASNSADNAHSMNNTASLIAQFMGTPPIFAGQFPAADINGDGRDDLLWRQPVSGLFADWLMNGAKVLSKSPAFVANSSFTLVAAGKFNGAGKPDNLVWSNSGSIWMWVPSSSGFANQRVGDMPAGWAIIGAGDIDGDGKADLIFRNIGTSSGAGGIAYWRMNGSAVISRSPLIPMVTSFHVAAIGDFNGDGKADILWTDGASLLMWLGTGSGFTQQKVDNYPSGWQLLGCGDVNGDGKCDLIWYNLSSGSIAYWQMNGASVTYKSSTTPRPPGYTPATIADFNGDGKVDIVWSNGSNLLITLGTGSGFGSASSFSSYPSGWYAAAPPPGN